MKLNNEQHARILNAYISRMSIADLEALVSAQRDCFHASMNLGTSSQVATSKYANDTLVSIIEKMLDRNVSTIEDIIEDIIS